jgi:hypothetical protein
MGAEVANRLVVILAVRQVFKRAGYRSRGASVVGRYRVTARRMPSLIGIREFSMRTPCVGGEGGNAASAMANGALMIRMPSDRLNILAYLGKTS